MTSRRNLFSIVGAMALAFAAAAVTAVKNAAVQLGAKASDAALGYMFNSGMALGLNTRANTFTGQMPVRAMPVDGTVQYIPFPFDFPAAAPAVNDLHLIARIPPNVHVLGFELYPDDIDTNGVPTLAASLGELNAGQTDLGVVYKAGITAMQTGASDAANLTGVQALAVSNTDEKIIGLKFTTAAATYAAGKRGILVLKLKG